MSAGPKYSVLLADDVAALRKLFRIAIETSGHFQVVAEASNGREAYERAGQNRPDLVLLDLSMPEMDGLEALPRILAASPRSRVVVLSGFQEARMGPIALRLGASAYLEKGIEPGALVDRLLTILEPGRAAAGRSPEGPASVTSNVPFPPPPQPVVPEGDAASAATFRVLLVAGARAALIERALGEVRAAHIEVDAVASVAAGVAALAKHDFESVIVEPAGLGSAEDVLIRILSAAQRCPVVALVPAADAQLTARALHLGVEDCLPDNPLDSLLMGRSILYARARRNAQESRFLAREQASELSRLHELEHLKTEFFNAAAHEIGTPLTPMRLQVRILQDHGPKTPQEARSLEILDRNIQRLTHLTAELLDVARLQSGRLELHRRTLRVRDVLSEVADSLAPMADERAIQLRADCPPEAELDADPKGLVQVLYNLVQNALKFTPAQGKVELKCQPGRDAFVFRVRDSGPGLRPEQVDRLFLPFSQVLDEAQPPGLGHGLGLFICRGIVEQHDGRIWCESAGLGKGSTFAFTIPTHARNPKAVAGA